MLDKGKIAHLLLAWGFYLGLVGFAVGVPLALMIIGTILYLI